MKYPTFFFLVLAGTMLAAWSKRSELYGSDNEMPERSRIVHEKVKGRKLSVYLPARYHPDSSYRSIYFHDGETLFAPGWDLQPLLDDLIGQGIIEPVVVVGIHSSKDRNSDLIPFYDPWVVDNWGNYQPEAGKFSEFIAGEIVPFIQSNFAVSDRREDTALFGASLGGLHVLWDAAEHPRSWGMVGAVSPSFWMKDYEICKTVERTGMKETRVWFDIGTAEWNYYVPVVDLLVENGMAYGQDLFYLEVPDAAHSPDHWRRRIRYPLIVFAGRQDFRPVSWQIAIEIIPSLTSDRIFRRINPIIETANGVRFSAATQADYTLLNPGAGEVKEDGRFDFSGEQDLEIKVVYGAFEQVISISK